MRFEPMRPTGLLGSRSALTIFVLAILAGCSSQRSPDCNDPSVISAIERNVNQIVESELSAGITEPTLLASARKVFQLRVEGMLSLTAVMEPPMFGVMEPQTGE